jgi:hypothetical protein
MRHDIFRYGTNQTILAHEIAGHDEYESNTQYNRYDNNYLLEFHIKAEPPDLRMREYKLYSNAKNIKQ